VKIVRRLPGGNDIHDEAKEVIGGFSVIDVPDLDAAIALVRTWPFLELPGWGVEVRPILTVSGQS
jgi:hypothetical protein